MWLCESEDGSLVRRKNMEPKEREIESVCACVCVCHGLE